MKLHKKYIFLTPILFFTSALLAEDKFLYILKTDSTQISINAEVIEVVEPIIDPTFWTIKGINVAGKYLTFRGVSSSTDSTCINVNFGQTPYLGNPNTYKSINPELSSGSACYSSGELIRDARFALPESGKYYFEISIISSRANFFEISELNGTGSVLGMRYGDYDSNYKYNYIYNNINAKWLTTTTGGFNSGDNLQFWVDIDAGNILINKLNYNNPSFYNNPILN